MDWDYLQQLQKQGIEPNFWCSQEYIQKANLLFHYKADTHTMAVVDEKAPHIAVLPPISMLPDQVNHGICGYEKIWSDFVGSEYQPGQSEFLDYEYIYDPKAFLNLSGGKWLTFRKNSRKWPNANPYHTYRNISEYDEEQVKEVFMVWLESRLNLGQGL